MGENGPNNIVVCLQEKCRLAMLSFVVVRQLAQGPHMKWLRFSKNWNGRVR